ncbi:LysR substrate-binding domain-containing protein [Burkholderia sp. LA-2-3-30-S1-D2]|uniref:LysR substrate-binding domain-containing protein n=1 Tax=Burkholderia sp. LA-2-3-30-S1-D2 TaxID=1637862 RepID=UPI000AA5BF9E|nr:LysR substrate-binding domain-containing protein [Burkholderia sp. LA-2-3-30-S1-D2]
MARYPLLRVELVMNDGLSNIIADGYGTGVLLGESLAEHVVAVPITPMIEMTVAGSPDYFARHGTPATPADLIQHKCLCIAIRRAAPSIVGNSRRQKSKGMRLKSSRRAAWSRKMTTG